MDGIERSQLRRLDLSGEFQDAVGHPHQVEPGENFFAATGGLGT